MQGKPAAAHNGAGKVSRTYLNTPFDGDIMNLIIIETEDALQEIEDYLNNKNYYVDIKGKMNFSSENDVSKLVFSELSV